MHLQSGSKRFYCCCCNNPGWSHVHYKTNFFPTVCLNPVQRQLSVLPLWHIHTPATDRPPLLLRCPRSHHRQSATHHYASLPRGLRTGFCHQQGECQRRMEECLMEKKQIPQQCTIYFTNNVVKCGNHACCCHCHYNEQQCICKRKFLPLAHL